MAFTVQNALDGFSEAYTSVTAARQLVIFLQVYREIMNFLGIEEDLQQENLTDGTREYELSYDPILTQIKAVYYVESATSAVRLTPVSVDWMDDHVDQWRTTTETGTPDKFYIRYPDSSGVTTEGKFVVGLDPIPDTTTSGGYPILNLYGTEYQILAATDKIPAFFPSVSVFVEGMKRDYASNRDQEKYEFFKRNFEHELHKCHAYLNNQIEDLDSSRIVPVWMNTTPVE